MKQWEATKKKQLAEAKNKSLSSTPDHGSHRGRSINPTPSIDNGAINIDTASQPQAGIPPVLSVSSYTLSNTSANTTYQHATTTVTTVT